MKAVIFLLVLLLAVSWVHGKSMAHKRAERKLVERNLMIPNRPSKTLISAPYTPPPGATPASADPCYKVFDFSSWTGNFSAENESNFQFDSPNNAFNWETVTNGENGTEQAYLISYEPGLAYLRTPVGPSDLDFPGLRESVCEIIDIPPQSPDTPFADLTHAWITRKHGMRANFVVVKIENVTLKTFDGPIPGCMLLMTIDYANCGKSDLSSQLMAFRAPSVLVTEYVIGFNDRKVTQNMSPERFIDGCVPTAHNWEIRGFRFKRLGLKQITAVKHIAAAA